MYALLIVGVGVMSVGALLIGIMIGLELLPGDALIQLLGKAATWIFATGGVIFGLAGFLSPAIKGRPVLQKPDTPSE